MHDNFSNGYYLKSLFRLRRENRLLCYLCFILFNNPMKEKTTE